MKNFSNTLVKMLVFFAVAGIIFILTLINTKLLLFLNWYKIGHELDKIFAIISGIAYALGSISVVIWYNPKLKQNASSGEIKKFRFKKTGAIILKFSFVILDGIHVFVYQNLTLSEEMIPEIASIVFALQTILILYFIGSVVDDIIKHQTVDDNKKSDILILQTNLQKIKSKLGTKESELKKTISNINELKTKINLQKSEFKEKYNKIEETQTKLKDSLKQKNKHIEMLEKYYFKSEKSRILKKNENNRTEEEQSILNEANRRISSVN